jgi:hypothetical protein
VLVVAARRAGAGGEVVGHRCSLGTLSMLADERPARGGGYRADTPGRQEKTGAA